MHDLLMQEVHRNIIEFGWHATGVFAEENSPEFVYSTGFYEHDEHPEMIILGLPIEIAQKLLWGFYDRIAAGERFVAGQYVEGIIEGFPMLLREMPADGKPLNVARRHYNLDELPALQVLWPAPDGSFPGQPRCPQPYADVQDIALVVD